MRCVGHPEQAGDVQSAASPSCCCSRFPARTTRRSLSPARGTARAVPVLVSAASVGSIVAVGALIGIVASYVTAQPALGLALRAMCALLPARSS